jgi:hypothetical protein
MPLSKNLHHNYFGKQLSQADWSLLYGEMCDAKISPLFPRVEALLIEKISSHIKESTKATAN